MNISPVAFIVICCDITVSLAEVFLSYYRIVEYPGPVSFMIWDRMAIRMKGAYANDLNLAEVDDWEGTEPKKGKRSMRNTTLAEQKEIETDEDYEEEEK